MHFEFWNKDKMHFEKSPVKGKKVRKNQTRSRSLENISRLACPGLPSLLLVWDTMKSDEDGDVRVWTETVMSNWTLLTTGQAVAQFPSENWCGTCAKVQNSGIWDSSRLQAWSPLCWLCSGTTGKERDRSEGRVQRGQREARRFPMASELLRAVRAEASCPALLLPSRSAGKRASDFCTVALLHGSPWLFLARANLFTEELEPGPHPGQRTGEEWAQNGRLPFALSLHETAGHEDGTAAAVTTVPLPTWVGTSSQCVQI